MREEHLPVGTGDRCRESPDENEQTACRQGAPEVACVGQRPSYTADEEEEEDFERPNPGDVGRRSPESRDIICLEDSEGDENTPMLTLAFASGLFQRGMNAHHVFRMTRKPDTTGIER